MTLKPGTRFGSYEVVESIGSGGMGEVYRASDTDLGRDIAVKVLPESFADDTERLARFQREAEILASLNHPNIGQIYGLERSDGRTALLMELVEGRTLEDQIAEGPIPVDEALEIASQIADAIEAAHGAGIVHRDLKPANIKLRPDGVVKVLDFGVAKAPEPPLAASVGSPALATPAMTELGVILGTAAYMSPEQARGKAIDKRADVWAYGCVLFEMLSGQPAFGGEDITSTLARVLERPADMDLLPASVPVGVRRTIELCLEKDPRNRLRDTGDVKIALTGAFGVDDRSPAATRRPVWVRLWIVATAVSLLAALTMSVLYVRGLTPELMDGTAGSGAYLPIRVGTIRRVTFDPALEITPGISPDGSQVVYTSVEFENHSGEQGPASPAWLPDGRLLFVSTRGGGADVYIAELSEEGVPIGEPERLTTGLNPHSIAVSGDGSSLVYSTLFRRQNVWSTVIPDGEPVSGYEGDPITTGLQVVEAVAVSPNGEYIAYDSNLYSNQDVFVRPLISGTAMRITTHSSDEFVRAWSSDGEWLSGHDFRSGNRDPFVIRVDGTAYENPANSPYHERYPHLAPDASRRLVYDREIEGSYTLHLVTRDGSSAWSEPRLLVPGRNADWSPDASRIAFTRIQEGGVWVIEPGEETELRRIADGPADTVRWTDDGQNLVYVVRLADGTSVFRSVDREGREERDVVIFDDRVRRPRPEFDVHDGRLYYTFPVMEGDLWVMELLVSE